VEIESASVNWPQLSLATENGLARSAGARTDQGVKARLVRGKRGVTVTGDQASGGCRQGGNPIAIAALPMR
jgi:hypothetical protein